MFEWLQRRRDGSIDVRTVTYGRKRAVPGDGQAEFVLTARPRRGQTIEEVMQALVQIERRQLDEVINAEKFPERFPERRD